MRKITQYLQIAVLFCILMILSVQAFTQTAVAPGVGDGSVINPYQIATLENLYWLTQSDTVWDKHFIQTADIDAASTTSWDGNQGFSPIGNDTLRFTGSYNGKGHVIDGIYINRPEESYIGLFGYITSSTLDSIRLDSVNFNGKLNVGGLIGINELGIITNCYTTGTINAFYIAGGLVGKNLGEIHNCFSTVNISCFDGLSGGFVGKNDLGGVITNSYSKGNVSGGLNVGGFVGITNEGSGIKNCYSVGKVSGPNPNYIRGFAYASFNGSVEECFWDKDASGIDISNGGSGATTLEMKDVKTYLASGWDFIDESLNGINNIWGINSDENDGYPFLYWQDYTNNYDIECEAPYNAASNIVFNNIKSNSATLERFSKGGYGSLGYAAFINSENSWNIPVDSSDPTADTSWKNTGLQCVYFGDSINPNVTVTGLSENTVYYLKIYAFNECDGSKLYEQDGLVDSVGTKITSSIPNGDGSIINPYQIADLNNLFWLSQSDTVWDKHFVQTADIDATSITSWFDKQGFSPIGNNTHKFTGSYNGKGHVIDGIYINRPNDNYIGLFGYLGLGSKIDSLGLTNISMKGYVEVGGIAGRNNLGSISNSHTSGMLVAAAHVGGINGVNRGHISNCHSSVDIESSGNSAGGLVGSNKDAIIDRSFSMGNINGGSYNGGFVGENFSGGIIRDSFSSGNVLSSTSDGGGFVGVNEGGEISNSYSSGNVHSFNCAGGFVGDNYEESSITNCYSIGKVTTDNYPGGFVGRNRSGEIEFCFWDNEASGLTSSDGGIGLKTSDMRDFRNFLLAGWDFMDEALNGIIDNWGINSAENNAYPFLSWQGYSSESIECQAPLSAIDKIVLGDTSINSITIDSLLVPGYGTVGYCIYVNTENAWTVPEDGTEPVTETLWKNNGQQCIYFGTSSNPGIKINGLSKGMKYYFKAFAYNLCSGIELYERKGAACSYNFMLIGNGSAVDPYIVSNLGNLEWVMHNDSVWNKHFIQTADINAASSIEWNNGSGFSPIGNSLIGFTGSYNGKGHTIDSIHINRVNEEDIGFFGIIDEDAYLDSIGLSNLDIAAYGRVGGLVGRSKSGTIANCHASGVIKATNYVGGLIGINYAYINSCFSNCSITASSYGIGGGFVGSNSNVIINSFSKGDVSGSGTVGGFVGDNGDSIKYCYSVSNVQANGNIGGFAGRNLGGSFVSCFWDVEISNQNTSNGGEGLTTSDMQNSETYLISGWDFMDLIFNGIDDIWGINSNENDGYPFLKWQGYENTDITTNFPDGDGSVENPLIIANLKDLKWLAQYFAVWDKHYIQTNDIDASSCIDWDEGKGFSPIGNATTVFTGNYNGNEYAIDQIYINRPTDSLIGFFGNVGSSAQLENIRLTNVNINGSKYVGGLVGYLNGGSVKNSFTTGKCNSSVSDTLWSVIGGLVGYNNGKISFSYSDVDVFSNYDMVGGLVGFNADYLSNSYSAGNVTGNNYSGGLVGVNIEMVLNSYSRSLVTANNYSGGLIGDNYGYTLYSFWDVETSGQNNSEGGIGLSSDKMKNAWYYNNAAWDFIDETKNGSKDYWGININENDGYPFLYWQGYSNIVTNVNNSGLEEINISIYPNPVSDVLNITISDEDIDRLVITDIVGKKIVDRNVVNMTEKIEMSSFRSGTYIINIYKGDEAYTSKIIKK